jgi:hypothetical protein
VALAEGLEPVCRPAVRLLLDSGLEPAEALLDMAPGMTASPSALAFDQLTVRRSIGLVVREHSWQVVVTPPRLRVALDGGESTDGHPLCLSQGQLAGAGPLRIELPGARRAPDLELVAEGRTVQTLRPYRDGGYNLRRLLDTAAEHPGAELRLRHEGRSGLVAAIERAVADDPWLPR